MNEDMMKLMMQMMMQQQQMMQMMMQQQLNPAQPTSLNQIAAPALQAAPTPAGVADLQQQLEGLKAQVANLQAQNQQLQAALSKEQKSHKELKQQVKIVEAYQGESFEKLVEKAKELSADDLYHAKEAEWKEEGYSNKEQQRMVKDWAELIGETEEEGFKIEF